MEKLGKESMKGVSGGQISAYKDDTGKVWYLLYNTGKLPTGIDLNKLRDAGEDGCITKFAQNEGKILKEFESENGIVGFITDDKSLARGYAKFFN